MKTIIKKLHQTEKMNSLVAEGIYGFVVDKKANKIEIKKAVESTYGVKVADVRTMICRGKFITKYTRNRIVSGSTESYKKAVVKLMPGETIDVFGEEEENN